MTTHALITGGAGFIGSHIAQHLLAKGHVDRVVLLDHFGRYTDSTRPGFTDYRAFRLKPIEDRIVIERGEAKFGALVLRLLNKYQPRYIFHLAALPLAKIGNLNAEEAREGSIDATCNFLETINELRQANGYRPERFVYASSSMVYGDFLIDPATEEHPTNPKEIYGTMKLGGEVVTRGLGGFFNIPYAIVRPSAVYGPTDMNRRVSQIFIEKALRQEPLNVQGADEALDFTYIKDIARGFVLAATEPKALGETFNITAGQAATLLDFVKCIKEHVPGVRYEVTERDAFRPKRGTLSIEKARKLIGYEPEYTLSKGVAEYVAFMREHMPAER
jgi:nucleoside-diphosphate-sugar epimerase